MLRPTGRFSPTIGCLVVAGFFSGCGGASDTPAGIYDRPARVGKADMPGFVMRHADKALACGEVLSHRFVGTDSAKAYPFEAEAGVASRFFFEGAYHWWRGAAIVIYTSDGRTAVASEVAAEDNGVDVSFVPETSGKYWVAVWSIKPTATGQTSITALCAPFTKIPGRLLVGLERPCDVYALVGTTGVKYDAEAGAVIALKGTPDLDSQILVTYRSTAATGQPSVNDLRSFHPWVAGEDYYYDAEVNTITISPKARYTLYKSSAGPAGHISHGAVLSAGYFRKSEAPGCETVAVE